MSNSMNKIMAATQISTMTTRKKHCFPRAQSILLISLLVINVGVMMGVSGNEDWINEIKTEDIVFPEQRQSNGFTENINNETITETTSNNNFEQQTSPKSLITSLAPKKVERTHSRFRSSSSDQAICLNVTAITKAVHLSEVVFAGKILTLYEQMPAVQPVVKANITDYAAKRRRESYFVGDTIRRIKVSPLRPTQQLKPFPRYEALVLVKTIFKGATKSLEDTTVTVFVDPNELVKQAGGTPSRCVRRLRALDTRLFFYKTMENPGNDLRNRRLFTSSSKIIRKSGDLTNGIIGKNQTSAAVFHADSQTFWPVPPTLLVLDAIRTAVRGKYITSSLFLLLSLSCHYGIIIAPQENGQENL